MPKPSDESFGKPADSSLDDDFELDELAVSRKPHFLDYDNKPPAELVDHCWNGAGKERGLDEEEEDGEEEILSVEKKEHNDVNGRPLLATVVCEQSLLFQRPPPVAALDATTTPAIPIMNVSYDVTTATVTTLNIVSTAKQGGGGTWPLKERPAAMSPRRQQPQQQQQHPSLNRGELGEVGPKMECVYSLLSMLGSTNVLEMSCKFLELSRNEEKCSALRRSGCVPLLVHIIHNEPNEVARRNARQALVNVVRCNGDEGAARRELKVLRLIDQLIDYTDLLKEQTRESTQNPEPGELIREEKDGSMTAPDPERHPIQAIGTLAKISYDEEHRHAMCQFGALQTIASLIQLDHHVHGSATPDALKCIEMRRYASMVLTNLTFGQGNNKALLCSNRDFMRALVSQLGCTELVQVTASVLRNLSWRADSITKQTLVEIETVTRLTEAAMRCTVENTLKSILSALWNLSNHCAQNRAKICEVSGALEFLIDLLSYEAPSKTWSVVENAGGILRNVSSHIAQSEAYRRVLREKQCLKLLLDQLKSPSLTVVSNACGTLGNLSSENEQDQRFLREHGAIPMLRSLIYSKHNIISNGSRLALKNLQQLQQPVQRTAPVPVNTLHETDAAVWNGKGGETGLTSAKPGLIVRKQRAMEQELGCAFYRKPSEASEGEEEVGEIGRDGIGSSPDADPEPETPINYGLPEERLHQHSYDYQETDIDQLTDYSLRYAENQSDSEEDEEKDDERAVVATYRRRATGEQDDPSVNVLMPEDSVKCYYTEGTPQIISSATSMSDLRAVAGAAMKPVEVGPVPAQPVGVVVDREECIVGGPVMKSNPIPIGRGPAIIGGGDTGCNTPDKPFNYCEEGTPDFSREASLSIIDLPHETQQQEKQQQTGMEEQQQQQTQQAPTAVVVGDPNVASITGGPVSGKSVSFLNTGADETPLMFSRTSSMGSLSSAEPACTDDKSSIVSEFSRMASGVMSPSELPDSPTQTIPHSPHPQTKRPMLPKILPPDDDDGGGGGGRLRVGNGDGIGAFADTVSKFNVEHTPAQFSCATSLSNLSLEEKDEIKQSEIDEKEGRVVEESSSLASQPPVLPNPADLVLVGITNATTTDEGHASDADSDAGGGEDDELLASCISIGMNSVVARSVAKQQNGPTFQPVLRYDESAANDDGHDSDDSSNLSDNNDRLLEECILSGMPKPKQSHPLVGPRGGGPVIKENPFKMMRTNDTIAPANDELNPFHIEDSPCNFSTVSALSELTMASDTMRDKSLESMDRELIDLLVKDGFPKKREIAVVSSPSVESETDDHLLDEAIAAGITGKVQHGRGDITDDVTKQLLQQNVSFLRREEPATSNHLTTNHGWVSPTHLSQPLTNNDSLPEDNDDSEQEEDYQLLVECIQKGMRPAGARGGTSSTQHDSEELLPLAVGGMQRPSNPTTIPKQSSSQSKNVQTTPAMSKDVGVFEVSPGVGSKTQNYSPSVRSGIGGRRRAPGANSPPPTDTSDITDSTTIYFSLTPSAVSNTVATSNSSTVEPATHRAAHERIVVGAANMASAHTAPTGSDELMLEQPLMMGESFERGPCAKHKNPERMLQSVERLTQELVSQVEERHVRTSTEECSTVTSAVEFKIGEKVTTVPGGGSVVVGLADCLHGGSRVGMMMDDEGNLESEEPPSILYQMSMPFVHHEPIVLNSIDYISLAPVEEQMATPLATTTATTMPAPSRVIKPVRVVSNPGSPRIRKLQRESSINKDADKDECKGKPMKSQDAKPTKKEQQTKIVKPAVESVTKVSRVRQPVPKGGAFPAGRTPPKPSSGSPIHRPTVKTLFQPHAQRSATKKLQPEPTQPVKQKLKQTPTVATGLGIARQDTFVLDKPTLSMHVPKVIPKVASGGTTEPQADGKPVSKIPLLKGEKTSSSSRIPPPKRTLQAGKQQPSKMGTLKTSPGGVGTLKK